MKEIIATASITNTASFNIIKIEDDIVYGGINVTTLEDCNEYPIDPSYEGFMDENDMFWNFDEFMRV